MNYMMRLFIGCILFFQSTHALNICTAANAGYFDRLLNFIGSLHQINFDELTVLAVYDLGLTEEQKIHLRSIEKVEIREIRKVHPDILTPFHVYGDKFVPGWYAWKPVAIKQELELYPTVLWLDAGSTVLKTLVPLFKHIEQNGYFLVTIGEDVPPQGPYRWNINWQTTARMRSLFNLYHEENKDILEKEAVTASIIGVTQQAQHLFIDPLYELAHDLRNFEDDGTAPEGFGCARYEQAILGIIAYQKKLQVFRQDLRQETPIDLVVNSETVPFHTTCHPSYVCEKTCFYLSREDMPYYQRNVSHIRYKAQRGTGKTIYLMPPAGFGEKIFDMQDPFYNKDDQNRPFFLLREKLKALGYTLKVTNLDEELVDFGGLLVCDLPSEDKINILKRLAHDKVALIILEPPTVAPHYYDAYYHSFFGKVLTMIDDYVDNKKFKKLHYPQATLEMIAQPIPFGEKKLAVLIAGNKISYHPLELYSERKNAIRFFERVAPQDFDFYGFFWEPHEFVSYRGSVANKQNILKHYKFCICYENMKDVRGYVTEKIFDVFKAGCVPVYWGANNITQYVPADCFIDRRIFTNNDELYNYLTTMSEEQYQGYLNNIRAFLKSQRAYLFSGEHFAYVCMEQVLS